MDTMPKYRPPFLLRDVSRHGQVRWYFRRDGKRIRLPAFGAEGFQDAYEAALADKPLPSPSAPGTASLEWLIARYMETGTWAALSSATRRQRDNIFKRVIAKSGTAAYSDITPKVIERAIEDRSATPNAARNFLESLRGLFRWAMKAGHVNADPTAGVKAARKRSDGFPVWTEADCTAYEARWPLGTRQRVAYAVLSCTGLRRGDAALLGRQHVKEGEISIRTEKTGEVITIPVLPAMAEAIKAGPCGDLTFIVSTTGAGFVKESFGNWFKSACCAAGVNKSAHGLRKLAATRLADAGATVAQLEAWFGWRGGGMASHYTRNADRKRLSRSAASLLSHPVSGETINKASS